MFKIHFPTSLNRRWSYALFHVLVASWSGSRTINTGPPTEHCLYVNDSQYDDLIHDTLVLIHFKNRHEPVQFQDRVGTKGGPRAFFCIFFMFYLCDREDEHHLPLNFVEAGGSETACNPSFISQHNIVRSISLLYLRDSPQYISKSLLILQ